MKGNKNYQFFQKHHIEYIDIYLILAAMCGTVLHLTLNHAFKKMDNIENKKID